MKKFILSLSCLLLITSSIFTQTPTTITTADIFQLPLSDHPSEFAQWKVSESSLKLNYSHGMSIGTNIPDGATGTLNLVIGTYDTPKASMTGFNNLLLAGAGRDLSTGSSNILIGQGSGGLMQTAYQNTSTGFLSGAFNVHGIGNVYNGYRAGAQQSNRGVYTANYNTFIGMESGYASRESNNSTRVGAYSGRVNNSNNSILLGTYAGYFDTPDGTLIISSFYNTPPLIEGRMFPNAEDQFLNINGKLKATRFILPAIDLSDCEPGEISLSTNAIRICDETRVVRTITFDGE